LVRPIIEQEWPEEGGIHGITTLHAVATAPTTEELIERIAATLQDAEVVAHNSVFAAAFVPAAHVRLGTVISLAFFVVRLWSAFVSTQKSPPGLGSIAKIAWTRLGASHEHFASYFVHG
jgi:DNA polymerase III alpha subunit (gram-positive type)